MGIVIRIRPNRPRPSKRMPARSQTTIIYALVDPRTDLPRYVGRTQYSVAQRMSQHRTEGVGVARRTWLDELADLGLDPRFFVLELARDPQDAMSAERAWLLALLEAGAQMTNALVPRAGHLLDRVVPGTPSSKTRCGGAQ